jgi:hypothetical protein
VLVRYGIRVASRFMASELGTPAEIRMRAAAKAVELALEHRIELSRVRETEAAIG